ncbi:MAG: tetratricopeptide repeat protein [Gammaproteobacteria bacterium]
MKSAEMRNAAWLIGMLVLLGGGEAWAIGNFKPTPAELGVLPAFCGPRAQPYGNDSDHPEVKPWLPIYGSDWIHLHHYCAGLNFINQSYRSANKLEKDGTLRSAVRELDYTLKNCRPGTQLYAEILLARGTALFGLRRLTEASRDLENALAIDPKLRRAYSLLADSYVALKRKDKALETVAEGIRHNPEAVSLKRHYDELGGKKPYPEPHVAETPAPPTAPAASETPADVSQTGQPPAQSSEAASSAAQETPAPPAAQDVPATPASIGSPTNPYCRFCP